MQELNLLTLQIVASLWGGPGFGKIGVYQLNN